jgi:hypothetical protein
VQQDGEVLLEVRGTNHMSDFDKRFKAHQSLMVKGASIFGLVWVLWALVCLAGTGALVYVAWHFISKFW